MGMEKFARIEAEAVQVRRDFAFGHESPWQNACILEHASFSAASEVA